MQHTNTNIPGDELSGLLEGWLNRIELSAELGISVDTLGRWETRRIGPPCVRVGRKVLYRADAVRDWLKSQEDRARIGKGTRAGGAK